MEFHIYRRVKGDQFYYVQGPNDRLVSNRLHPLGDTPLEHNIGSCRYMNCFFARTGLECEHWIAIQKGFTVEYVRVGMEDTYEVRYFCRIEKDAGDFDMRAFQTREEIIHTLKNFHPSHSLLSLVSLDWRQ